MIATERLPRHVVGPGPACRSTPAERRCRRAWLSQGRDVVLKERIRSGLGRRASLGIPAKGTSRHPQRPRSDDMLLLSHLPPFPLFLCLLSTSLPRISRRARLHGKKSCMANIARGVLQREFNRDFPTIYTTCQCYLKDSLERLATDLERARRGG